MQGPNSGWGGREEARPVIAVVDGDDDEVKMAADREDPRATNPRVIGPPRGAVNPAGRNNDDGPGRGGGEESEHAADSWGCRVDEVS